MVGKDIFLQHIKENEPIIYKLARLYAADEHELKDMYQETVYQAWKAWPGFKGDARFSTWLYRLCLNTLLAMKRKNKAIPYGDGLVELAGVVTPMSIEQEQVNALYKAIKTLSETDRALITMHLDGFSNPEIAEMVGISDNYVAVKLSRIREQLYQLLNSKGYGY